MCVCVCRGLKWVKEKQKGGKNARHSVKKIMGGHHLQRVVDVRRMRTLIWCRKCVGWASMKQSDHFVTLAQKFWDTDQVLFARGPFAARLVTCERTRRMFRGQNVGKQRFQSV